MPTVLVDGEVIGVWDVVADPHNEVRVHFLAPTPSALRRKALERAAAMTRAVFGESLRVAEVSSMTPLTMRAGWVNAPLQGGPAQWGVGRKAPGPMMRGPQGVSQS
jgi:hypothetical protein